jgi:hypothetical protein
LTLCVFRLVLPLLMAKVLWKWQDPQEPGLVENLRLQFAGQDHAGDLNQLEQHLLNQDSANLNLNSAFINNGILNRAAQNLHGVRAMKQM